MQWNDLPKPVLDQLRQGAVIPAHPLALGPDRQFDKQSQRAISRYYVDAGSGGLAVGVHSTQFAISLPPRARQSFIRMGLVISPSTFRAGAARLVKVMAR